MFNMLEESFSPEDVKANMAESYLWKDLYQGARPNISPIETVQHIQTWLTLQGRLNRDSADPRLWER